MSTADGEIEIAVRAEGVDDAAAELGEADGDGRGGPPRGDGGGDGLRQAFRGGLIGGLLSQAIGPLLDTLDPILKILQAFLAPLATLLLRLLSPVLRFLIQLLPAWMWFIDNLPGLIQGVIDWVMALPGRVWDFMADLPGMIWTAIEAGAGWIADGAVAIGEQVWEYTEQGFEMLVGWLEDILNSLPGFSEQAETVEDLPQTGFGAFFPDKAQRIAEQGAPGVQRDLSQQELREARKIIELGFDVPEWIRVQVRDENVSNQP